MRIALVGSRGYPYVYSGYETFVRELGERLVRRGHAVTVYGHRNLFPAPRRPVVNGIRCVYLPTVERKSLAQFLHSAQAVPHACLAGHDVLLVVNAANGPFGIVPRLLGVPAAVNVDGLEWRRPKWRGLGARYFHWAARLATRLFARVVTDSAAMREIYLREFGRDSVVIAYGADPPVSASPERLAGFGLRPGGYDLVTGRLIPDNNGDLIVRGWLRSGAGEGGLRLVVVGDVPYRDAYAQSVRRLAASAPPAAGGGARVLFTGYVRDRADFEALLVHARIYLHGHEFGGTNPSLLQAMAAGCAVLALDNAFNREVLDGGRCGALFPKSEADLAAALAALASDPDRLAGYRRLASRRVAEAYSWEDVTDRYCRLFEELINI